MTYGDFLSTAFVVAILACVALLVVIGAIVLTPFERLARRQIVAFVGYQVGICGLVNFVVRWSGTLLESRQNPRRPGQVGPVAWARIYRVSEYGAPGRRLKMRAFYQRLGRSRRYARSNNRSLSTIKGPTGALRASAKSAVFA